MLNTLGKRTKTNIERVECGSEGEDKEGNQVRNPAKSQLATESGIWACGECSVPKPKSDHRETPNPKEDREKGTSEEGH